MNIENVVNLHNGVLLSCYKEKITKYAGKWLGKKITLSKVTQI